MNFQEKQESEPTNRSPGTASQQLVRSLRGGGGGGGGSDDVIVSDRLASENFSNLACKYQKDNKEKVETFSRLGMSVTTQRFWMTVCYGFWTEN